MLSFYDIPLSMVDAIISDLDGTLYSKKSHLFKEMDAFTYDFLETRASLTQNQIKKMEKRCPNILDALDLLGIKRQLFYDTVYDKIDYTAIVPNSGLKDFFTKINLPVFIVSLSPQRHVEKVLKLLDIAPFITKLYTGDVVQNTDKKTTYVSILKKYHFNPEDVLVIGDDYDIDLKAAEEMGCRILKIQNGPEEILKSWYNN